MDHRILHALFHILIILLGVAIAERNPGENNAAENIPAQPLLPAPKHVTEEGLGVAIQSVIQAMEDKFARLAHQMNEMREELRKDNQASVKEGQIQLAKDIKSAEERIKEEIKTQVDTLTSTVTRDHEAIGMQLDNITCPVTSGEHHTVQGGPTDLTGPLPSNCAEIKDRGNIMSGVYVISLSNGKEIQVYCDMTTDEGGWTVLQRRADITPRVDFKRSWSDYKKGFGDLEGEFWLGLDNIHSLTSQPSTPVRLGVDLESWKGEVAYAEYDTFVVSDEGALYRLSVGGYTGRGGAGDATDGHNGRRFSTFDKDSDDSGDRNLADEFGSWWHGSFIYSSLNGPYLKDGGSQGYTFLWWTWKNEFGALKKSEMRIRPLH